MVHLVFHVAALALYDALQPLHFFLEVHASLLFVLKTLAEFLVLPDHCLGRRVRAHRLGIQLFGNAYRFLIEFSWLVAGVIFVLLD